MHTFGDKVVNWPLLILISNETVDWLNLVHAHFNDLSSLLTNFTIIDGKCSINSKFRENRFENKFLPIWLHRSYRITRLYSGYERIPWQQLIVFIKRKVFTFSLNFHWSFFRPLKQLSTVYVQYRSIINHINAFLNLP